MSLLMYAWEQKTVKKVNRFWTLDVPFTCALLEITLINIKHLMEVE